MPDRYANGDPANDRGGRTRPAVGDGIRPGGHGWFHGGDLRGLTGGCTDRRRGLQRIKDLGFSALWVTPSFGQRAVQGTSAAYHGYWGLDFTTVDPHLGTDADFAALVECAHRLGLKVYLDVVVNHTGDVIALGGSVVFGRPVSRLPRPPFSPARYAGGKTFPCLKARGTCRGSPTSHRPTAARRAQPGSTTCAATTTAATSTSPRARAVLRAGRLLRARRPVHGAAGGRQRAGEGLRRAGSDASRSTASGSTRRGTSTARSSGSGRRGSRAAARAAGVRDFEIFGEVFVTDTVHLSPATCARGVPNVLDFPLWDALVRYVSGSAGAHGIRDPLRGRRLLPICPRTSCRRRPRSSATTTSDGGAPDRRPVGRQGRRAAPPRAPRSQPPLPSAWRSRGDVRRRGRDRGRGRRQAGAPGSLPDPGPTWQREERASRRRRSARDRPSTSPVTRSAPTCVLSARSVTRIRRSRRVPPRCGWRERACSS